jgi:hypothetical protein
MLCPARDVAHTISLGDRRCIRLPAQRITCCAPIRLLRC